MTLETRFDNRPIGIFDSGLGGLTVVRAVRRLLPNESILYLGDTARVPYGNKSVPSIISCASEDVAFMRSRGVKMMVAACNTVSAVALPVLEERPDAPPVLGVIGSGVEALFRHAGLRQVAVIGTRATVSSDAYRQAIHGRDSSLRVESIACPLLVPMAEEGITDGPLIEKILELYLGRLRENPPDALLLGCTHYPLFRKTIEKFFDGKVQVIDSAEACAEAVKRFLAGHGLSAHPQNVAFDNYFVTDLAADFNRHAAAFLGSVPANAEQVKLAAGEK